MMLLVLAAVLVTTIMELAPPWLIRYAVDQFILAGRTAGLWWVAGGLLGLSLLQGAIDFARLYLGAYVGQRIIFGIRNAIFEHLSQLSFSFYDRTRTGDLMSRVTADVDALSNFFSRAVVIVVGNSLTLLGILGVLLVWDWRLGLLYLFFLPLMIHGMLIYARRLRPVFGRIRRKLADLTTAIQESLVGIQVIKLFGREDLEEERIDRQSENLMDVSIEAGKIRALWMPYVNVLSGVFMAFVLWVGGGGVMRNVVSLGTLIGFTTYINMLFRPIRQTGMMLNAFMRATAAAQRVFGVLDIEPEVKDAPDAYPLPPVEGRIRYEHVHFSYNEGDEVLHDITLDVAPGEMVALVGPSGTGKTTMVHLLPRFYDVDKGRITIDGHDIRDVTLKSLRDAIGIALQTVFLFDASIGENIAYGSADASQEDIEWAARTVQIHDFIASLPLGYGTPVGERGVRLSGGQRQRIALARVLLTDPHILILDEPTSSVDADTERRMQQAMETVREGRTTFVIAHRLWTVQQADRIVVLKEGRIAEEAHGTEGQSAHELLMREGGLYKEMYDLQFQGEMLEGVR
ncbi:MAG: ABC transporter ATP-binding protein [Chloroflexota bacterium]|nr:ABC transporter ATP-binding protein [Chloroflexota bacterium]